MVVCDPADGNGSCERATLERLVPLGFERRVELRLEDRQRVWAHLPLPEVDRLGLSKRQTVVVDLSRSRRVGAELAAAG